MGAYGSPELFPYENQYNKKEKKHWGKFVGGFFTGVVVAAITIFCIAENNNVKLDNLLVNSYSASQSMNNKNESEEIIKKQAEGIVKKYLQDPESVVFSDNANDWIILKQHDNGYDVMLKLTVKNSSKQVQKIACRVVFSYVGKSVKEEYLQIGGNIVYDSLSVSSASGKAKK